MQHNYESEQYIHIFRTNVAALPDLHIITPILNTVPGIQNWSVDLSDCDKVLRVQCGFPDQTMIVQLVKNAGYYCEEMID